MASRARFPVYRGEKPFIFISYAHVDSVAVLPIAEELHKRGYRVWYDEGIEAGARWAEFIANHLENAAVVLFFPSENFNTNRNCEREINFAVDAKKTMACVCMDDAPMPPGMKMQLSPATNITAGSIAADTAERIIQSGALQNELIGDGKEGYEIERDPNPKHLNTALIVGIVGIALAVVFGVALLGYMRGWFGEKPGLTTTTLSATPGNSEESAQIIEMTTWSSTMMRDLIISQTSGEALYCCGNAFVSTRSGIDYQNSAFCVGGTAVQRGDISDLTTISKLINLIELAICYQNITDLTALQNLTKLTYLDLSGNDVKDLMPLSGLDNISVLKLSHTGITDLSPALEMTGLQKLYVSLDMVPYVSDIITGNFEVVVTE